MLLVFGVVCDAGLVDDLVVVNSRLEGDARQHTEGFEGGGHCQRENERLAGLGNEMTDAKLKVSQLLQSSRNKIAVEEKGR